MGCAVSSFADKTVYQGSPCGLEWYDVREGTGAAPTKGQRIRCHYRGRLTDGHEFDTSYGKESGPFTFNVGTGSVIDAWDLGILGTEGVPPMKAGGMRKLRVPAALGYGAAGAGAAIPGGATLLFDVELL